MPKKNVNEHLMEGPSLILDNKMERRGSFFKKEVF